MKQQKHIMQQIVSAHNTTCNSLTTMRNYYEGRLEEYRNNYMLLEHRHAATLTQIVITEKKLTHDRMLGYECDTWFRNEDPAKKKINQT